MVEEKGIEVKKSVSVFHKEIKVNPKNLFLSLSKMAIKGTFLQWDDLAENGVEVLNSLGLAAKPGEMAGLLIVRSLLLGMKNLQHENRELIIKKTANLKALYQKLNDSLATNEIVINEQFFRYPRNLPILTEAQTGFRIWLEEFVERKVEAERISDRLPTYFVDALNQEWLNHSTDYQLIKESLDTPFTQATQRQHKWLRYQA